MPRLLRSCVTGNPLNGLSTVVRFGLSSRAGKGAWAGPDAMLVGCTGSADARGKVKMPSALLARDAPTVCGVKSEAVCLCGHDADPLEGAAGNKPQYRVRKSTCSCCHDAGLVLAMHAGEDEAA